MGYYAIYLDKNKFGRNLLGKVNGIKKYFIV